MHSVRELTSEPEIVTLIENVGDMPLFVLERDGTPVAFAYGRPRELEKIADQLNKSHDDQ